MHVDGATALVTGASGGLGGAIARALHELGARLVLSGRRKDVLEPLAAELDQARVVACDLADAAQVAGLADQVSDVDIVVANAALPATGQLADFSADEIDRAINVNLRAPIQLTRALLPEMLRRRRGHFVYVSSIGGKLPSARLSIYAATKSGLRGFSGCLRQDLAGSGVSASVIFPGSITDVGMLANAGLPAAPGTKGRTSADVAKAVVAAIEQDKAEIEVAELMVRIATKIGGIAPTLMAKATRRQESLDYADELARGLGNSR